jgi:hypothetical protein
MIVFPSGPDCREVFPWSIFICSNSVYASVVQIRSDRKAHSGNGKTSSQSGNGNITAAAGRAANMPGFYPVFATENHRVRLPSAENSDLIFSRRSRGDLQSREALSRDAAREKRRDENSGEVAGTDQCFFTAKGNVYGQT